MAKEWEHGQGGYTNHKCRCPICTEAATSYGARRKLERAELLRNDPSAAPHGLASTYGNYNCRCRPCTNAWTTEARNRRQAKAEEAKRV